MKRLHPLHISGRGRAAWLAVALLALPAAAAQEQDWISRGQELIRGKQLTEALQLFDRVKQQDPADSRPFFYSGVALLEAGRLRQAGAEFRGALALDPERPEYVLLYAETLQRLGLKDSANTTLAPLEDPARWEALDAGELWLLGDLYLRVDRLEESLRALRLFQQSHPADPRVALRRGEIQLRQGDYAEAEASYREAAGTAAGASARYGLGLALWKQGRLEEALQELRRALELQPDNREVQYHLGMVALDLDQPEDALRYLEPLEAVGEQYPFVYSALARAYRRAGNVERSRALFERFQQTQVREYDADAARKRADAGVSRALEELQQGRVTQARGLFEEVLADHPGHWVAHKYLARIYLDSRQWGSAFSHLQFMEGARPEDFDTHSLLAEYWYARRQYPRAQGHAERAKALRPGDPDLRNLLGNVYLALDLRSEALAEYQAAVRLAPERADFQRNLKSLSPP